MSKRWYGPVHPGVTALSQVAYAFGLAFQVLAVRMVDAATASSFVIVATVSTVVGVVSVSRLPDAVATTPAATGTNVWRALVFFLMVSSVVLPLGVLVGFSLFDAPLALIGLALCGRLLDGSSSIAAGEMLRLGDARAHASSWAIRGAIQAASCLMLVLGGGLQALFASQVLFTALVLAASLRYVTDRQPLRSSNRRPLVAVGLSLSVAQASVALIPSIPRVSLFEAVTEVAFANFGVLSYLALAFVPLNQGLGQVLASRLARRGVGGAGFGRFGGLGPIVAALGAASILVACTGYAAFRSIAGPVEGISFVVVLLSAVATAFMLWSMPMSVVLIAAGQQVKYAGLCVAAVVVGAAVAFTMRSPVGAASSLAAANAIRFSLSWRLTSDRG